MSYTGPHRQEPKTDVRWHVTGISPGQGGGESILRPSALSPDTVIRSHDFGMYQPRLDRPNPYPDIFTSVVVEKAVQSVDFYLVW